MTNISKAFSCFWALRVVDYISLLRIFFFFTDKILAGTKKCPINRSSVGEGVHEERGKRGNISRARPWRSLFFLIYSRLIIQCKGKTNRCANSSVALEIFSHLPQHLKRNKYSLFHPIDSVDFASY